MAKLLNPGLTQTAFDKALTTRPHRATAASNQASSARGHRAERWNITALTLVDSSSREILHAALIGNPDDDDFN